MAVRSGRWVVPKRVGDEPLDARAPHSAAPIPAALRMLPSEAGVWLTRRLLKRAILGIEPSLPWNLGLPRPQIEPWEERPTISTDFIEALQAKRIDVRPGIERFDGRVVHFSDGSTAEVDVVLYATGYDLDFPFFDRDTLGCEAPDLRLYQRISHTRHDNLFFVGCCRVLCPLWPLAEQQGRWIARLMQGKFALPRAEKREHAAVLLSRSLPVVCNFYVDQLRSQAGGL
jgi:hypothetical protein